MPHIYLQTNDGVKIAVPEEAAALSLVLRRALDYWAETYRASPPLPEEDDDDGSESGRTPDHLLDDDDNLSTRTRSVTWTYSENRNRRETQMRPKETGTADPSDDSDRTKSIIDDDGSSRTPSRCSSPDASSAEMVTKTPRGGSRMGQGSPDEINHRSVDSHENGRRTPEFATPLKNKNEMVDDAEDSATPSTLDEDEEDSSDAERRNMPTGQEFSGNGDTPPRPELCPPAAHAHPFALASTTVAGTSTTMGDAHSNSENLCTGVNLQDTVASGVVVAVSSEVEPAPSVRRPETTTIVVSSFALGGDDNERFSWVEHVSAPSTSPKKVMSEDFASPGSYHQRTPCMIGDEDDGLLIGTTLPSPVGEEAAVVVGSAQQPRQYSNKSAEIIYPAPSSEQTNSQLTYASRSCESAMRQRTAPHGSILELEREGSIPLPENVVSNHVHQCARITEKEIIIELPSSFLFTDTKKMVDYGSSTQSTTRGQTQQHQSVLAPHVGLGPSSVSESSKTAGLKKQAVAFAAKTSSDSMASRFPLVADVVPLCVTYLNHFAGDVQQRERLHPTLPPEPLSAPLVAILTPWEREFLYYDILGQTKEQLAVAMAIMHHAPDMSYIHPGPFLSNQSICKALMVDVPSADRISLLVRVMHAAEMLQIPSLQNICAAWCADFIIRASYASIDHFEAAALVRKCFRVENDWTKRERDCLKLENEWPSNEE